VGRVSDRGSEALEERERLIAQRRLMYLDPPRADELVQDLVEQDEVRPVGEERQDLVAPRRNTLFILIT
jgi:hypothetical protein